MKTNNDTVRTMNFLAVEYDISIHQALAMMAVFELVCEAKNCGSDLQTHHILTFFELVAVGLADGNGALVQKILRAVECMLNDAVARQAQS